MGNQRIYGSDKHGQQEGVDQVLVRKRYPGVFCIWFASAWRFVQTDAAWTGVMMDDLDALLPDSKTSSFQK